MKKNLIALSLLSVFVLAGCTTNEANIAETTADSFNVTPVITESVLEESPALASSEAEVASVSEELVSEEVTVVEESVNEASEEVSIEAESSEPVSSETSSETEEVASDESVLEESQAVEDVLESVAEGSYTNYDLEGDVIEDDNVKRALNTVVKFLKENNHYFDSAEYHFDVLQLEDSNLLEVSIAEQYSDGEIMRGIFEYNIEKRSIEMIYK